MSVTCICGNATGGSCLVPAPCDHARVVFVMMLNHGAGYISRVASCHGCGKSWPSIEAFNRDKAAA